MTDDVFFDCNCIYRCLAFLNLVLTWINKVKSSRCSNHNITFLFRFVPQRYLRITERPKASAPEALVNYSLFLSILQILSYYPILYKFKHFLLDSLQEGHEMISHSLPIFYWYFWVSQPAYYSSLSLGQRGPRPYICPWVDS